MMMILVEGWVWLADLPGKRYARVLRQEVLNEHSGKRYSTSTPARGTQRALRQEALKEDSSSPFLISDQLGRG